MNLIKRIRNLWRLGGIEVDGFIYDTQRKQVINKITDVFMPSQKEDKQHIDEYSTRQQHKMAIIIKRETPTEKFLKEAKENGI